MSLSFGQTAPQTTARNAPFCREVKASPALDSITCQVDRTGRDIESAGLQLARYALADQARPSLFGMPADESQAGGEQAELNPRVSFPEPCVRGIRFEPLG